MYSISGMVVWLLLAAAFVLFKENRCLQALWILLPVILFKLLWAGLATLMRIPSEASVMFVAMIDCLLIGFVLSWLLAERIGNRNRFVTWLLALALFALAFGAVLINLGFGIEAIQISVFLGLTVGILLLSFTLAGFMCRKKFSPVRFSVWMAVWVLLLTNGFFMAFVLIQCVLSHTPLGMIPVQVLLAGLIFTGILIILLLPFEILLFKNAFWRTRFEAVFRLKTKSVTIESVQLGEKPSTEISVTE